MRLSTVIPLAVIFLLSAGCHLKDTSVPNDKSVSVKRYRELRKVIDQNTGNAHFTRGVNAGTILALKDAVTDEDIPVLKALINDDDHVMRLAAGYVLSTMGERGIAAMNEAKTKLNGFDVENAIRGAEETTKGLEATRKSIEQQKAVDQESGPNFIYLLIFAVIAFFGCLIGLAVYAVKRMDR